MVSQSTIQKPKNRGQRPHYRFSWQDHCGGKWHSDIDAKSEPRHCSEHPHHVTQRGNHRQKVFYREEDHKLYLAMLTEFLPRYGVALEAYCLMTNHVHLIATPHDTKGLSAALQRVHSDYARALHLRLRQNGHLWQSRFHSTVLDENHFWTALSYVEQNPVRAGLVLHAVDWRWSSARARLGLAPAAHLDLSRWHTRYDAVCWNQCLTEELTPEASVQRLRKATQSGFSSGDIHFAEELERRLGIRTRPRKPGSPKTALMQPLAPDALPPLADCNPP